MKIKIINKVLFIVFLHPHQELNHQHVRIKFLLNFYFNKIFWFLAVFLSPPSSSASSTTTSLRIDCNIKTETMDTITTKNHQQQALAITRAFDNLAKAASHVRLFLSINPN